MPDEPVNVLSSWILTDSLWKPRPLPYFTLVMFWVVLEVCAGCTDTVPSLSVNGECFENFDAC